MERQIERIALDSNVVSYIFNRDTRAPYYEERIRGHSLVISFQTLEEAWYGAYHGGWGERRMSELEAHLGRYEVVWPTPRLVYLCAQLRAERGAAGSGLQMQDAWIAATALYLDCPLASHDSHFVGIPNLQLIRAPVP